MIIISDYQEQWNSIFAVERKNLLEHLDDQVSNIYHIGSTSIPNMAAKPIIDILLELNEFDHLKLLESKLINLGYTKPNRSMIPRSSAICTKNNDETSFHLHIFGKNDPQIERHLNFRDFLTANQSVATDYAELKKQLVTECVNDKHAYNTGKVNMVHDIDCAAKKTLKDKNVPKNIDLKKGLVLNKNDISELSLLNNYQFITHYSQYIETYKLHREPGVSIVQSDKKTHQLNHIIDIDYSNENLEKALNTIYSDLTKSTSNYQWWDSFNSNKTAIHKILSQHMNNIIEYESLYKIFDEENDAKPNDEFRIEQLLSSDDITNYELNIPHAESSEMYEHISLIAMIPHTENDVIQHYKFIINGEVAGYFTLVFYANVVGLYWFDSIVANDQLSNLLRYLTSTRLHGYNVLTIIIEKGRLSFTELGLLKLADIKTYIT
jgi:GrpB-like predicted nucleotidyltransferase (UPF0157 family)